MPTIAYPDTTTRLWRVQAKGHELRKGHPLVLLYKVHGDMMTPFRPCCGEEP